MINEDLYKKAIAMWGHIPQINMVNEECGELLTALARYLRGRADANDVITEVADVAIMMEQMAVLFGKEAFEKEKERKLQRLKERLEKAENGTD
jgi:NTP pyrophosphatase (non-canonical NTP hydrolase)